MIVMEIDVKQKAVPSTGKKEIPLLPAAGRIYPLPLCTVNCRLRSGLTEREPDHTGSERRTYPLGAWVSVRRYVSLGSSPVKETIPSSGVVRVPSFNPCDEHPPCMMVSEKDTGCQVSPLSSLHSRRNTAPARGVSS